MYINEIIEYKGCIGVTTSMKSLSHKERSEVARESINRLCNSRKLNHYTTPMLDTTDLTYSGSHVILSVTSNHLEVILKKTNETIIQHEMKNVSFASSGDDDTKDFVAYVAKDNKMDINVDNKLSRACFVFQCSNEKAREVLEIIAKGFEKRTEILCGSSISHNGLTDMPWFHGSLLSREESESRLIHDGDFLVREKILEHGNSDMVLSVMLDGTKLHILIDELRTMELVFNDISDLIKYHHDRGFPIVTDSRKVYLRNGVRRPNSS